VRREGKMEGGEKWEGGEVVGEGGIEERGGRWGD